MFTLHSEMFSSLLVAPMISIGEELWPPLSTVDLGSANVNPFTLFLMGNFPRASPSLVNWLCQDGNYLASSSLGIMPLMRSCGHETPWWQGVNCLSCGLAFHTYYMHISNWGKLHWEDWMYYQKNESFIEAPSLGNGSWVFSGRIDVNVLLNLVF